MAEQEKSLQNLKTEQAEAARKRRLETQGKVVTGALLQGAIVDGVPGAIELFDKLTERAVTKDKNRLIDLRVILLEKRAAARKKTAKTENPVNVQ